MKRFERSLTEFVVVLVMAGLLSGCSLFGKRRYEAENDKEYVQISILNGRGFDEGGKYFFAIYDGELPEEESASILQLYSLPASD